MRALTPPFTRFPYQQDAAVLCKFLITMIAIYIALLLDWPALLGAIKDDRASGTVWMARLTGERGSLLNASGRGEGVEGKDLL